MKQSLILPLILAVCFGFYGSGCTASGELEESNENQSTPAPEAVVPPPEVVRVPAVTSEQGFTTKEDTIEVESAQRDHRTELKPVIVQRRLPAGKITYRVQIGAFREESNARRLTTRLAKQYPEQTTFFFDAAINLYRVTTGNFSTENEARRFARTLKKKNPKECGPAWVIEITE